MMMMKKKRGFCIFISLILLFFVSFVASQTVGDTETEDEREFDYDERSKKGPRRWGSLKREWEDCNNGHMQSPVDMSDDKVKLFVTRKGRNLISRRFYKPANATLKNRGHDISLQWVVGEAGSIKINGTKFYLQQAHWHSPSEHTINGRRYDMELHLVHVNPNINKKKNHIAVIGILYQIGHHQDPFLSKLMKNISNMSDKNKMEIFIGLVDPKHIIKINGNKYYRYMGSLTVPPCTQGVIWTIIKNVKMVSEDQVHSLREAVQDHAEKNARPVQPLNNREIYTSSALYI